MGFNMGKLFKGAGERVTSSMAGMKPAVNAVGMYAGGGFLGAAAGGGANLAFGDPEDFMGATLKGAGMGLVGGAAVRSLTTRGGHLNSLGEAIGMSLDDAATAGRATKLEKLQTKAASAEGDELNKLNEQIMKLQQEQESGGGMTRFFRELGETSEERRSRVVGEYKKLAGVKDPTQAQIDRMGKLERDYGVNKTARREEGEFIAFKDGDGNVAATLNKQEYIESQLPYYNDPAEGRVALGQYFDQQFVDRGIRSRPAPAGYEMHESSARRSVHNRNRTMMMGGAGLTGAMVGLSHSSGRKNKRRGFNKSRGSRF